MTQIVKLVSELLPHQVTKIAEQRRTIKSPLVVSRLSSNAVRRWLSWEGTHECLDKLAFTQRPRLFYRKANQELFLIYDWNATRAPAASNEIICFTNSETYQADTERLTELWNSRSHLISTVSLVCQRRLHRIARWGREKKCSMSFFSANRSLWIVQLLAEVLVLTAHRATFQFLFEQC